jgi:hypothetical protein
MESLSNRVKALRREIAQIAERNRQYFEKTRHSPNEQAEHEAWKERVYEIRDELFALLNSSEAQKTAA